MRDISVTAQWDEEAQVWVAESDDVPGLVCEAETREALLAKLAVLIPELLEANAHLVGRTKPEYVIHWSQEQRVRMSA